ncbi:hypothetical protein AB0B28_17695 [Glycomyces sp. NPDC046736]|uniref:hypothetical protein n=1 Tax=Glycomyces sp. NPDC046736 TaxID=3155615 RepID=UPI0033F68418
MAAVEVAVMAGMSTAPVAVAVGMAEMSVGPFRWDAAPDVLVVVVCCIAVHLLLLPACGPCGRWLFRWWPSLFEAMPLRLFALWR